MRKYRKAIERVKTALIAVLIITAVLLGAETGLFEGLVRKSGGIRSLFGEHGERNLPLASNVSTSGAKEAAMPVFAAVTGQEGAHNGVKYSSSGIRELYNASGTVLSEAIGSATGEKVIDEKEWRAALLRTGVYCDYLNPVPFPVLSSWLGVQTSGPMSTRSVRRICVATNGSEVELYYYDEITEGFFACTTAVQPSALEEVQGEFPPNGAIFAFETENSFPGADSYTLILQDNLQPFVYASENPVPLSVSEEEIVSAFGINPYSSYAESDGTQVYIETSCSLRISPDGRAEYTSSGTAAEKLECEYSNAAGAVECARTFVAGTIGKSCGAAEVYLISVQEDSSGYKVRFGYFIDSVPVYFSSGESAAEIVLSDGRISEVKLCFKSYSPLEQQNDILPDDISAAAMTDGSEPILCYIDGGAGTAHASRIVA